MYEVNATQFAAKCLCRKLSKEKKSKNATHDTFSESIAFNSKSLVSISTNEIQSTVRAQYKCVSSRSKTQTKIAYTHENTNRKTIKVNTRKKST